MNKLQLLALLILGSFTIKAQNPTIFIGEQTKGVKARSSLYADSAIYLGVMDTNFTPKRAGALIFKNSNKLYYTWDGTFWKPFGSTFSGGLELNFDKTKHILLADGVPLDSASILISWLSARTNIRFTENNDTIIADVKDSTAFDNSFVFGDSLYLTKANGTITAIRVLGGGSTDSVPLIAYNGLTKTFFDSLYKIGIGGTLNSNTVIELNDKYFHLLNAGVPYFTVTPHDNTEIKQDIVDKGAGIHIQADSSAFNNNQVIIDAHNSDTLSQIILRTDSLVLTSPLVTVKSLAGNGTGVAGVNDNGDLFWTTGGGSGSVETASNGLTKIVNDIQLGGTLTANTSIATGIFGLQLSGSNTGNYVLDVVNGTGNAINGHSSANGFSAVYGSSTAAGAGIGVAGVSTNGTGVDGYSTNGPGIYGTSINNYGIAGQSINGIAGQLQRSSNGSNVVPILEILAGNPGTGVVDGVGGYIDFKMPTSPGFASPSSNQLISKWTDATHATRTSEFSITGVNSGTTDTVLSLSGNGAAKLGMYGTGLFTGTPTYSLQVDASGNIIEGNVGGGGSQNLQQVTDIGFRTTNSIISSVELVVNGGSGQKSIIIVDSATGINMGLSMGAVSGVDDRGAVYFIDALANRVYLTADSISPAGAGTSVLNLPVGNGRLIKSVNGTSPDIFGDVTVSSSPYSLANFYLKDSSLSSNRIIDLNGKTLVIQQSGNFYLNIDPVTFESDLITTDGTSTSGIFSYANTGTSAVSTGLVSTNGTNLVRIDLAAIDDAIAYSASTQYFNTPLGTILTIKPSGIINIYPPPEYADNAAALAGTLVAGDVYRTGDFLKVVH